MTFKKNLFFNLNLRHNQDFFSKNLRPHFQNSFVPRFFFMLSMLSFRMEYKKAIENRTPVYFCLYHEFYKFFCPFWGIFAAQFLIFLQFFSGVQKCVWKDVIQPVIVAIKKKTSNIFILREFCKITHCLPIVTLALLLFLPNF